jgi:hypothetical protein
VTALLKILPEQSADLGYLLVFCSFNNWTVDKCTQQPHDLSSTGQLLHAITVSELL